MQLPTEAHDAVVGVAHHSNGDIIFVTEDGVIYRIRWDGHNDTYDVVTID